MRWGKSDIAAVRRIADAMCGGDDEVHLPGWHRDELDDRAVAIINAALAVVGRLNADRCTRVAERELGALLGYIADVAEVMES